MKHIKILLLFLIPLLTHGQVVDFGQFASKTDLQKQQKSIDSLSLRVKELENGGVTPTPDKCKAGPELNLIENVFQTQLTARFHGDGVERIAWKITAIGSTIALASGEFIPTSNTATLNFALLPPGRYLLTYTAVNCTGESSKDFEIKSEGSITPPTPTGLVYEMLLNTTGRGFSAKTQSGLEDDFPAYIDKFKFSWGWGITGIRVCVRWYDWEPTVGNYQTEGLKRIIQFCKERGLSLSLCFWPVRKGTDPIMTSQVTTNLGNPFFAVNIGGVYEWSERTPAFVDPVANQRIFNSVKKLSEILYTYDKAGYISFGGGTAEEMVWPYKGTEITDFSPENMASFRAFVNKRGLAKGDYPEIFLDVPTYTVNKTRDLGKEWLRHQTYTLRKYFDNFVNAVHAGSSKGKACYFMGAVGSVAHDWTQDGHLGYLAANADEFYHTDGNNLYDVYRKELGVNVGIGTLGIPTHCEYDPEDLGAISGGGFKGDNLEKFASKAYARGSQKIHLAMAFFPDHIVMMEPSLKNLRDKYVGKAFTMPTVANPKVVDITEMLWKRKWMYGEDTSIYQKSVAPNFWGGVEP